MSLLQLIEKHWYIRINIILLIILLPISLIYWIITSIRKFCYAKKIFKSYKLNVPVVIIGNISVGGVGKTPLTKYISQELQQIGIPVGVILRGYKGNAKSSMIVKVDSDSLTVGDEALIYAQYGIPVAIGRDRYDAGLTLLAEYPDIKLILSDDGLQHYRLQRDYEIAVIDATRFLGNKFVLPMGPLRETPSRLKTVNAIVINGDMININHKLNNYLTNPNTLNINQEVILLDFYNPVTNESQLATYFTNTKIIVIAAMGNPQRFFNFIYTSGVKIFDKKAFSDHFNYTTKNIPNKYDVILVTEKDYTKLKPLNNPKIWIVRVTIKLDSGKLIKEISELII